MILATLFVSCATNEKGLDILSKIFSSTGIGLTEQDAADGIREALVNGTIDGVEKVSKVDGYLGNAEIKILLPPDAIEMEKELRSIGLGKQVDQALTSMNRAAEDAAMKAKPIFMAAIKNMTITDAINIVKGNNDAATRYLEKSTSSELNKQFQPAIKISLDKVNATKYWATILTTYNKIPLVDQIDPNLPEYVTTKAIEGLFVMIANEELKIRTDPVARTSELLKKVFGN